MAVAHSDDFKAYHRYIREQHELTVAPELVKCFLDNGVRIGEFAAPPPRIHGGSQHRL